MKASKQMTVREIRRILFETDKFAIIGSQVMSNKESRDFLYGKDNQEEIVKVIDNVSHLRIS